MPPMFYGRVASIFTLTDRASGRLDIWLANLHMAADHPLFGVGFGNSPLLVGRYLAEIGQHAPDTVISSHNVFLQLLAELGLLGFGLFVAFVLCLAWRFSTSLRHITASQRGICAVVAASATSVLVYCLVEPFLWQKLFWVVAGLTAAAPLVWESGSAVTNTRRKPQIGVCRSEVEPGASGCSVVGASINGSLRGREPIVRDEH